MFSMARKQAQQLAQQFLSGHCTLIAWWTLRHAGVFEAILQFQAAGEGLDPLVFATRTSMSPDVLRALLDYLSTVGLVQFKKDGVRLTSDGKALLEHEDAVLEMIRAYQPLLDMAEHLLARLKTYASAGLNGAAAAPGTSVVRKTEYLVESQAKRYAGEIFPAITDLIAQYRLAHVMDLNCGSGDLLMHIAQAHKRVVGVGIGIDGIAVRKANAAITAADLEKRLIAVTASPYDVCTDTQRTFDRIGVSRQLWKEISGLVAVGLFSEWTSRPEDITRVLTALRKNFPTATLLFVEPTASPRFDRNYYAPELTLLLSLARATPLPPEKWREILAQTGYKLLHEEPLNTDGLTIFVCKA